MTLTTLTLDGNDYQAYVSIAEADAILAVDPIRGPSWTPLTDDQKIVRVVAATNRLDLERYPGEKTDPCLLYTSPSPRDS